MPNSKEETADEYSCSLCGDIMAREGEGVITPFCSCTLGTLKAPESPVTLCKGCGKHEATEDGWKGYCGWCDKKMNTAAEILWGQ